MNLPSVLTRLFQTLVADSPKLSNAGDCENRGDTRLQCASR